MPGTIIKLVSKRVFEYSFASASSQVWLPFSQWVDVSQYREATMLLRVHSISVGNAASYIAVYMYADAFTDDDPAMDVYNSTQLVNSQLTNTTVAPSVNVVPVAVPFGKSVRFAVFGNQQGVQGTLLKATLSADLVCKS